MAGGSAAGGGVAGGGGGAAPVCPSTCPVYAPCEPSASGGRCADLSLSFSAPPSLGVFDAGAVVPVQVLARLVDGGAFAVMVPLTSSFGTNTSVSAGVSTTVALPSVAGAHRLTAGWDGGPNTSVSVLATSCVTSCQPYQSCRATTDGGACDSLNLTLTWTSPDAGLPFNASSVPARLTVTRAGGPVPATLTSIPVSGPMGPQSALSGSAGVFTGALSMSGPEGDQAFVAGWPSGGPTASLTIERDTVPPGVALTVLRRPLTLPDPDPSNTQAWKKNETAIVQVEVDGGRAAVASDLSVLDSGVVITQTTAAACNCVTANCRCFEVPLLRANDSPAVFVLVGPISDPAGNLSPQQSSDVPTTRFLWSRPCWGANCRLGLSESGLLVVSSENGSSVRVTGIAPDGGTQWSWTGPAVSTSRPVVGVTNAFVSVYESDGTSSIKSISLATGALNGTFCEANDGVAFAEPMVLATTAIGTEVPLAFRKVALVAATGGCPTSEDFGSSHLIQGFATQRDPNGELGAYLVSAGVLRKFAFTGFGFVDGGVGSAASEVWLAPGRVGWVASGNGSLAVAATSDLATQTSSVFSSRFVARPNIGATAAHLFDGLHMVRCDFDSSFVFAPPCQSTVTQTNVNSGATVKTTGGFVVHARNAVLELRDDGTAGYDLGDSAGSDLLLDPPRAPNGVKSCGSGLGTVYVVTRFGRVAAYLADAQGVDGTAHWPQARHDNANSGNLNRALAPWSCP
ncbi:MAG: hypothetical protein IAE78_11765 [Myxococcus sp.]|nr:hypothetical protein [Myxococcus sp.]